MSWISRATSSHHGQLAITAVVSGVVAACTVVTFQEIRRRARVQQVKEEAVELSDDHVATKVAGKESGLY
jgi:hypothetical protein